MSIDAVPPMGDFQKDRRDLRWWLDRRRPHEGVFSNIAAMENEHESRTEAMQAWLVMYLDRAEGEADWGKLRLPNRKRRHRLNATLSGVRTVHSQVSTNRPRPWVVTSGGDHEMQSRGKKQTKYIEGEFERLDAYELTSGALEDALWAGHGFIKCVEQYGRPHLEAVWPGEIMLDTRERRYGGGRVRTMYQRKAVDKEVLEEMYPGLRARIREARRYEEGSGISSTTTPLVDQALVVEAWHLPTRNANGELVNGRHVICIDGATLKDEEWNEEYFPFAEIKYLRHPRDYFGVGLVEIMSGTQSELDHTTAKISDCFNLLSPKLRVDPGAKVNVQKIGNVPWEVIESPAGGVEFLVPPAISTQFLQYQAQTLEQVYSLNNISLHSAQGTKPPNLSSGRALLVHQEVESRGQISLSRAWEKLHVDLANLLVRTTRRIARDPKKRAGLKTEVGESMLEEIAWSDAEIKDDPYRVKVFPVSSLSKSPAGRLEQIQQMIDMQVLTDPDEIRELLDYPDLERYNQINSAGRELVEKRVEQALEGEEAKAVGEMPLEYARRWGTLRLLMAELQNAPEEGRQRLRDFLAHVDMLEKKAAEAAAMAAGSPPQPAGALPAPVPEPPPQMGAAM
jgi:hypothetical protein